MATYAVGDIQGCIKPLKCLLRNTGFRWSRDRLWLVGDLVNRGPKSLKVLRYLYRHRSRINCVLGNHDLHLLAVANGLRPLSRGDTLHTILVAPDRDKLLDWLRQQPLLHTENGYTMVHAGIPPMWDLAQATACAREVEAALSGPDYRQFLASMYGDLPNTWDDTLSGMPRLRLITNYLTRMRFVDAKGGLDLESKGATPNADKPGGPWFDHAERRTRDTRIIFGHWAALDRNTVGANLYATDTGCVWGNKLSMYCLETEQWHRCDCG